MAPAVKRLSCEQLTITMYSITVAVVLVLVLVVQTSSGAQHEENDIAAFLNALDTQQQDNAKVEKVDSTKSSAVPAGSTWGIPDAVATVGKIFKYDLPRVKDQQVGKFKVSEVGGTLPSWLALDEVTGQLLGVPGTEHAGQRHYLEVVAMETVAEEALRRARDMFTVHVTEHTPYAGVGEAVPYYATGESDAPLSPIKCPAGSSLTTASIIVDVDLEKMLPAEKVGMLQRMCEHLQLPTEMLSMLGVTQQKPMYDSSALVAGPGDVKHPEHPGAVLHWEVGCGNVHSNQMPVLQTLESTAAGTMPEQLGHGVIGWHVTNNKMNNPAPQRVKRQARRIRPTPTPVPSVGAPTRQPVPTRIIPGGGGGEPTGETSHKHPHKHRTKTKGRHPHHHKTIKHSPKATAGVTQPSAVPIQPTSVIKVMPTTDTAAAVTPEIPPRPLPSPGSTVIIDSGIEPSMTPPLPGGGVSSTPTLPPKRPTIPVDVITTQPVEPSQTEDAYTPSTKSPDVLEPTDEPGPAEPTDPMELFNYPPILKKDIQRLTVYVGEVLNYRIPKDTFNDYEDGNTRNLKLVLLTVDGMSPVHPWVKLNAKTQRLYGMPLPLHEGRQEYMLTAIDTGGKLARDPFEIDVKRRPSDEPVNHELSMSLDLNYERFIVDVDQRMEVAEKVASVFGDSDTTYMTVTRIDKGSVIYAWANNSLPTAPCPTREIAKLVSKLLTENNTIQPEAEEKMKPYKILKAGAERQGACAEPEDKDNGVWSPGDGGKEVASKPRETSDNDVLLTTVVPAVIIAAMLLLAALIACVLYRKRRKGKLSDEDQHTFINKGIPIIFADELEDDKPDLSSKPLIMADEKPPLPPPEYPRSNTGSIPSSPGSQHKEGLLESGDELDLYQPPPPPLNTGTTGSRGSTGSRNRGQPYSTRQPYVQP